MKGYRKLALGAAVIAIGVGIDVLTKNGLTSNVTDLLKWVAAGFFAGNGLEHISGSYYMNQQAGVTTEAEAEVPVDQTDLALQHSAEIQDVGRDIKTLMEQLTATNEGIKAANAGISWIVQYCQQYTTPQK